MKDKDSEIRMDWLEDGPRLETSLRPHGKGTGMPLMQGMGPHHWVSAFSIELLFCVVTREGPRLLSFRRACSITSPFSPFEEPGQLVHTRCVPECLLIMQKAHGPNSFQRIL